MRLFLFGALFGVWAVLPQPIERFSDPGCEVEFGHPENWGVAVDANEACSFTLRPAAWDSLLAANDGLDLFSTSVRVVDSGFPAVAERTGFTAQDGAWTISGRQGFLSPATELELDGLDGVAGEAVSGCYGADGTYVGICDVVVAVVGDRERAVVIRGGARGRGAGRDPESDPPTEAEGSLRRLAVAALLALGATPVSGQSVRPAELVEDAFVALRVADVEAAAAWYAATFDVTEVRTVEGTTFTIHLLRGGGLAIELIQQDGDATPAARQLGLFKSGIFVRDVDAFHAEMLRRGVDADDAVFVDEALDVRSFVMRDPEGNRLQPFERCAGSCGGVADARDR